MSEPTTTGVLTEAQVEQFVHDGAVRLEEAFPRALADRCRALLWDELEEDNGCAPHDPATWTRPVIRIGGRADAPFQRAATTGRLHAAFDQLVGPGRWLPRDGLGTFPIRFPHPDPPGDDGWHVDAGWHVAEDDETIDWSDWSTIDPNGYRVNLRSRGRALLMLFLFSDVGPDDAPTRVRRGSHLRIPEVLAPAGEGGTDLAELPPLDDLPVAPATGVAGDVWLCHPFLAHAAQRHRGTVPRFMAQPPLYPAGGALDLDGPDAARTPVVRAIHLGL
jgi:hypothetical protein